MSNNSFGEYAITANSKILENLYLSEDFADFHFMFKSKSGDGHIERIPVHRNILAAVSDEFRDMFKGLGKKEVDVEIVDASADAFKEFLQFFYLPKAKVTIKNATKVMNLGQKYRMTECFNICEQFVKENLRHDDVEQLPDIFKLDIDCLGEAMDYLPIKYLFTIGQTCKRLRKKAGYIINESYLGAIVNVRSDEAKYFPQYIRSIEIKSQRDFNRFVWKQKKFYCLERLLLADLEIKEANVDRIKRALTEVTTLCLTVCEMNSTTFEKLIDSCPKIKRLCILEPYDLEPVLEPTSNDDEFDRVLWFSGFRRKYPTLESFELNLPDFVMDLSTFLELNPNIKKLTTGLCTLWQFKGSANSKNINLDELITDISFVYDSDVPVYCNFLNELYEREFFKRLYLDFGNMHNSKEKAESLTQLMSIKGLAGFNGCVYIFDTFKISSKYFADLIRVDLWDASFEFIMLLITSSKRLKHIIVASVEYPRHKLEIVNLSALNEARQKLASASLLGRKEMKVTIFIGEKAYLATKWAYKGNECGLIHIRRLMAYNQNNSFTYMYQEFNH